MQTCGRAIEWGWALLTAFGSASQRLVYFDVDPFGEKVTLTAASLFPTINGAATGTLAYRHSENIVERLARVCTDVLSRFCSS